MGRYVLVFCCWIAVATRLFAGTLIAPDSNWKYFKGFSEASSPDATAWREWDFNDSGWASGQAAFYYENQPGSATAYTGHTLLSDMFGGYTCVFLRQNFVVSNIYDLQGLQLAAFSDDGFLAWINGNHVASFNMPADEVPYNGTSSPALAEPIPWWTNNIADFRNYLRVGTNVLAVQAFNSSLGGSSDFVINPALYFQPNVAAPTLTFLYPDAGSAVRQLTTIEVGFSEPVAGVDPADLLINGQPATNVTEVAPGQFLFMFPQPATGLVQVAWATGHGISDLSSSSNAFSGGAWSYTLNPNLVLPGVIISEFMAANSGDLPNSLHDELGNSPDWIELYNATSASVSLTGWSLTDDSDRPGKWHFPPTLLPARSFLVVFASGRNTNVNGQLHTNFRLSSSPAYLGLYDSGGNVISSFTPQYPQQFTDVSYGRDLMDPTLVGYYTNATPGAANANRGSGFGPEVQFSRAGGTFVTDFQLALSVPDPNFEIRYVLVTNNVPSGSLAVTNVPTETSPLYTDPISVPAAVQVRARAFPRVTGFWPGPPRTECFLKISPAATTFSSDLPVLLLHNLAGGAVPQSTDQSVIAMVFEPVNGRTCLTNPPTLVSRAGLNIRGSSTAGEPQSPFALELWDEYNQDNPQEFLGMPAQSDWVLYGQDGYDTSYLHNPLAHQLSRDVGRYSSRTRFAEVFLNTAGGMLIYAAPASGNYFGLYTVEEKIKRDNNRVDIAKLEPQITTTPDITGGYLLKIDRADSNERSFYDPYCQTSIVFQEPPGLEMVATARQAQYNYITAYFSQFGAALWGSSFTNPVTGYAAYIDVDSWIDHHILNVLAFNVDALRLSGYFFKDRNEKIEMGPLWDFDRSMGSADSRCFNPRLWRVQLTGDQGTDFFGNPSLLGVRWWQQLFIDPDFWQHWIDRWTDLRRGVLATNHLYAVVDGLTNQLRQAQPREKTRWSNNAPRSGTASANGYSYYFTGTYASEIAFLKRWLADRVDFIDTNFLRAPVFSSSGGVVTQGLALTITAPTIESNTVTYYTLDGRDPRLPGGAIAPYALAGQGAIVLTINTNARVFARNYNPAHRNMTGGTVGGNPPISSPWSGVTAGTFIIGTPTIVVTEIMYHPAVSGTNDAEDFEFIELKNVGAQALNLVGIRFTNGIDFTFTATNPITSLAAGQYVVLVKNRSAFSARYPAVLNIGGQYSGSLDNSGEELYLEGALKEPILDFKYNDAWYPTTDGLGFSLVIRNESAPLNTWTNAASWRPSTALSGSPGRADPAPLSIPPIVINEALTHTDPPETDTIELYNPTASEVSLAGWFLTDDPAQPAKYVIRSNVVIGAYGYLSFTESDFNSGTSNSFALSSLGDQVYLFSGDGTSLTGYRQGFNFGPQVNGVTFGRYVTSDGEEHFVTERANSLGSANAGPKIGPVIVSEMMYSPPPFGLSPNHQDEFVELHNISAQWTPLYDTLHPSNTWKLDDGVQFTFPPGVVMAPGAFLLVVNFDPEHDPVMLDAFRKRYSLGTNVALFGPFQGNLANEGEGVGLYFPDKPEIAPSPIAGFVPYVLAEEVHYSSLPPWPAGTDATGNSLQRISSLGFGDEPLNWIAGLPSPGAVNAASVNVDTDGDGMPDEWEVVHGLDPQQSEGTNGPSADPDGDGATNWQEYIAGTDPFDSSDYLRFDSISVDQNYCALQFRPRAGRVYAIEARNSLSPSDPWVAVQTGIAGTQPYTLMEPLASEGRLYRITAALGP